MYCIIDKIECIDGGVVFTPIGYTTNLILCDEINVAHDNSLGAWNTANLASLEDGSVLISEFFDTTPLLHIARTTTNSPTDLPEVNNIEEL
jgi:hypothetical protein